MSRYLLLLGEPTLGTAARPEGGRAVGEQDGFIAGGGGMSRCTMRTPWSIAVHLCGRSGASLRGASQKSRSWRLVSVDVDGR